MKGTILKYGVVFSMVIGSGGVLMNISQHVQRAEREIKIYDREIAVQEEAIRVLKAEWAYLNNPLRLELLASKGLDLASPEAVNIISDMSTLSTITSSSSSSSVFVPSNTPKRPSLRRDISYVPSSRTIPPTKNTFSINNDGGAQ